MELAANPFSGMLREVIHEKAPTLKRTAAAPGVVGKTFAEWFLASSTLQQSLQRRCQKSTSEAPHGWPHVQLLKGMPWKPMDAGHCWSPSASGAWC